MTKILCLYLIFGLFMIVAQTTVLRLPLFGNVLFDLMIPFIVFLGLGFPNRKGVLVAVILGLVMDLLSGGIFGLHITVYFWIFLSIQGLSIYFDVYDKGFQAILIGACVLGQHLIFLLASGAAELSADRAVPALVQTILAAGAGPFIVVFLGMVQTRLHDRLTGNSQRDAGEGLAR